MGKVTGVSGKEIRIKGNEFGLDEQTGLATAPKGPSKAQNAIGFIARSAMKSMHQPSEIGGRGC